MTLSKRPIQLAMIPADIKGRKLKIKNPPQGVLGVAVDIRSLIFRGQNAQNLVYPPVLLLLSIKPAE